jgi:hypothetical protein
MEGNMAISLDDIQGTLHSIKISDGTNDILIDASGHLSINDGGNSLTIDSADLTTLAGAVSGTEMQVDVVAALPAGTNNIGSITVTDGTDTIAIAADGSIAVTDNGGSLTIDNSDLTTIAGAVSGTEMQVDVVAALPTGSNTIGKAYITDGTEDLAINADGSINVQSAPAGLDSWQTSTLSATSTAGEITATPLSNRLKMIIQNLGAQDVYLGEDNTVTTSSGMKLPKGSSFEISLGATANIWAITSTGSSDLRIAEYAD